MRNGPALTEGWAVSKRKWGSTKMSYSPKAAGPRTRSSHFCGASGCEPVGLEPTPACRYDYTWSVRPRRVHILIARHSYRPTLRSQIVAPTGRPAFDRGRRATFWDRRTRPNQRARRLAERVPAEKAAAPDGRLDAPGVVVV